MHQDGEAMLNVIKTETQSNYTRKYKTSDAHKAIKIIHEMHDRNASETPDECRGEHNMGTHMYWLALKDSINIKKVSEMLEARRDILLVDTDGDMIPGEEDRLPLDYCWSLLTAMPYTEWQTACVSLWRDIRDNHHSRERCWYHLRKLGVW